jgi:hypothetical protein
MTRQNALLDPFIASCHCGWELAVETSTEKERREAVHAHAKHGTPLPAQPVAGNTWQERAADAVQQVAARGADFRIYDALAEFGLADPPNAKTSLGRFAALMHDLGHIHKVSFAPSNRGATKGSAAGVWNRDGRRCIDERCKRRAGVA